MDALLRLGDFTHDQLRAEVERYRGRHGVNRLREVVPLADARAETLEESALRMAWRRSRLPDPELQIPIVDDEGRELIRLDLGDPEIKYAADFDPEPRRRTPAQVARDDARRIAVRRDGWTIDVFDQPATSRWSAGKRLRDGYRWARDRHQHPPAVWADDPYADDFHWYAGDDLLPELEGLRYQWFEDETSYCDNCGQPIRSRATQWHDYAGYGMIMS